MEQKKDWRAFIPRGTKARLAQKYGLTLAGVCRIIRKEDVLNYPELMIEVKEIGMKAMDLCRKYTNTCCDEQS